MATQEDIQQIVDASGNSFHCRVANYMAEKEWAILVSPYYMDGGTSKPREIDLIAEKHWIYKDRFERKYGAIVVKLFIECKYIPQPNVFWFGPKDETAIRDWLESNTPLRKNNTFSDRHHYLSESASAAKLFASKNLPNTDNEPIFKALNQALNAMIYLRGHESLDEDIRTGRLPVLAEVEMPVVICNNFENFYRVDMSSDDPAVQIEESFQLEVNYAYVGHSGKSRSQYFLLDIVDFTKADEFLELIENDVSAIKRLL